METIDEIAAEIGEKSDFCHNNVLAKGWEDWEQMHEWLLNLRSRIEAAWNREHAPIGNASAMREALKFIKLASDDYEQYGNTKVGALDVIYEKACAALSAPPRNCDVGTAEEQAKRYHATGEVYHTLTLTNALEWAQMPYKESEASHALW